MYVVKKRKKRENKKEVTKVIDSNGIRTQVVTVESRMPYDVM